MGKTLSVQLELSYVQSPHLSSYQLWHSVAMAGSTWRFQFTKKHAM